MNFNNDQRRGEKSWNDPPMFSMEQLNKASNTVPVNKRYRYPQQPIAPQPTQPVYPNYQQSANPAIPNSYAPSTYSPAMINQQQPQQYPSYTPYSSGVNSGYGQINPPVGMPQQPLAQNYNYPSYPGTTYPPASSASFPPINSNNQQSTTTVGYNNASMPSPYGSGAPLSTTAPNMIPGSQTQQMNSASLGIVPQVSQVLPQQPYSSTVQQPPYNTRY